MRLLPFVRTCVSCGVHNPTPLKVTDGSEGGRSSSGGPRPVGNRGFGIGEIHGLYAKIWRECPVSTCAVTRRRFSSGCKPHPVTLQPEATGAVMEVTKWLKPSDSGLRIGNRASVQAATRVSAPGDWQGVCGA